MRKTLYTFLQFEKYYKQKIIFKKRAQKKSYILHFNLYNILPFDPTNVFLLIPIQNFETYNFWITKSEISYRDLLDFRVVRIYITSLL